MKRFFFLILTVFLFAGCNNLHNKFDSLEVGEARLFMDVSQFTARAAEENDTLISTLEFVGEEPSHEPFEKTQFLNGTLEYSIKGLPIGSSVQVKLSFINNGILIAEGISNKITVSGDSSKNGLNIDVGTISDWLLLQDAASSYARFDINFNELSKRNFSKNIVRLIGNGSVYASCKDEAGNFFYITFIDDQYCLCRLDSPYNKEIVVLLQMDCYSKDLYYDSFNDSILYAETSYDESGRKYYKVPNASTTGPITMSNVELINVDWGTENLEWTMVKKSCIYNNEFYWIQLDENNTTASICKMPLSSTNPEDRTELVLYKHEGDRENGTITGAIGKEIASSWTRYETTSGSSTIISYQFNSLVSDLAVTDEGVFALLFDSSSYELRPEYSGNRRGSFSGMRPDSYNAARGGIIKMNHGLTKATLMGWTETKHEISMTNKKDDSVSKLSTYRPKASNLGFYGPLEIVAIKPKKLIFLDRNEWSYVDDDKNVKPDWAQRYVILDLETLSYNVINTTERYMFGGSGFTVAHAYEKLDTKESFDITETWK